MHKLSIVMLVLALISASPVSAATPTPTPVYGYSNIDVFVSSEFTIDASSGELVLENIWGDDLIIAAGVDHSGLASMLVSEATAVYDAHSVTFTAVGVAGFAVDCSSYPVTISVLIYRSKSDKPW